MIEGRQGRRRTVRRMATAVATVAAGLGLAPPARPAPPAMNAHLEPLKPLVGRTWRSELSDSTKEKPVVDVSRFELALNGQAVRNLHSINDGEYGGETLIVWDREKGSLVFYYFTTAGFYTTGSMRAEAGALVTHETVKGEADGITEVRSTSRVLPDGRLHVKTEYLRGGTWVPGRDVHYSEAPNAAVRFKD